MIWCERVDGTPMNEVGNRWTGFPERGDDPYVGIRVWEDGREAPITPAGPEHVRRLLHRGTWRIVPDPRPQQVLVIFSGGEEEEREAEKP